MVLIDGDTVVDVEIRSEHAKMLAKIDQRLPLIEQFILDAATHYLSPCAVPRPSLSEATLFGRALLASKMTEQSAKSVSDYPSAKRQDIDSWELKLRDLIKTRFYEGDIVNNYVQVDFETENSDHFCQSRSLQGHGSRS